ncbi:type III PLP-dependent enzyme [Aeromonas simiae]|uniref:type III PLP-dependent enzyme n=1 Tax=Aeromonas simiae TaxID=218936 RepID=UPI00266C8444|nr:type III PLP-dependent enzyme [Aeromonas simiae]MDO2947024.1 type III PLP-dependent enzyme [Aeromonas simiae]MDO2950636.1 type III PLP-dependent enzyme [Aeromonas simiae]MDO2954382.1 type III PLP-dependent enzyme [Aeromonas simiae]
MNETSLALDYRQLVEQHGSPLLLLDKAAVRKQYRALAAALPDVRLHYALKPLPHPALVEVLKEEGACFDLATNGEVDLVKSQGVRPGRCIHTHPIKRDGDICHALEYGCTVFVYDNPWELDKFLPYKDEVKLLLRVSFPNPETKVDLSKKFGCTPEQALPLMQLAQAKGLKVMGLSFHVGSQVPNAKRHVQAIDACREILEQAWELGLKPWVLDIGGGFPVDYEGGDLDIDAFCAPIREALAKLPATVQRIAEPGRFISAPAMTSVASVMGKAHRGDKLWYYLDDGLYGSYNGQLYDHVTYPVSVPYADGELHRSVLAGPTCDSVDVIRDDIVLPELEIGDLVVGRVMGAYTWASASTFNFFPKADILVIDSSQLGKKLTAVA